MKAVGYQHSLPVTDDAVLIDFELPEPVPGPRDLLVRVRAIAVNPVDTKIRMRVQPESGQANVLGWDCAGEVEAVGSEVTQYQPGDAVWYAGALDRPGCNSELHVVDERIVSRKPESLDFAHAAAMPLTSITAWELLFDRLQVPRDTNSDAALLIMGGGGGVGSMLVQLARQLTSATVIASASRPETIDWVKNLGAHHVIDHHKLLADELTRVGAPPITHAACLIRSDLHFPHVVDAIAPQGRIGMIDDPGPIDVSIMKRKSLSLHWEFMYTRSLFHTPDMDAQHTLLAEVARLVDAGTLKTTFAEHYGTITAANLRRAHTVLESGASRGKIVLEGF